MSRSWKHNIHSTAINVGNTWTRWGGQRWAVACRQTEVTEVSPRVLAVAQLSSQTCHPENTPGADLLPGNARTHRGIVGNVFCSTPAKCLGQTTRWMLTTSGNVQSVKISREFAAKYLAFHGLIFFFDALRIKKKPPGLRMHFTYLKRSYH